MSPAEDNHEFEALIEFIKQSRGFDFTGYKTAGLMRRVRRRMQSLNLDQFSDYLNYLEVHPEEFGLLFNTILINMTAFFRDPLAWECLANEVVPEVLKQKDAEQPVRVWSAGCASGEEAYTLAMVFAEALGLEQFQQRVKIYATDMDEDALARARHASYSEKEMEPLPVTLREKYFDRAADRYVFRSEPRRAVIFGRHDLMQDAPISRLDLLVCRNTLMYFNAETQGKVLSRFHFALDDLGFLFLGKAELLLAHASYFTPANLRFRIFRKISQPHSRNHVPPSGPERVPEPLTTPTRHARLREAVLEAVPAATMVVDSGGNLALATKHARDLFSLTAKNLGQPFRDLEMSYRPVELRSLIDEVMSKRLPVSLHDVEWTLLANGTRYLDVQLVPLPETDDGVLGIALSFTDVTSSRRLREELQHANQALETAYEELQSTNEELETTNEELQSTVEELETTNEELQSTNEEMETMNEELQSTNEELQTTNEELRRRTDELSRANFFLESILASVRSGVVVMDRMLNVHVWSPRAEDLWGLRPDEVQGQPFLNLDFGLPVECLKGAIRAVLNGDSALQEVTLDAVNRRGKTIKCRVTCTPLFGARKELEGTVLLMEECGGDEQEEKSPRP